MSEGRATVGTMRVATLFVDPGPAWRVEIPTTRRERARGLRGRDRIEPGSGMLLPRARSIHTIGMRFEIAVAYLDVDLRILEVVRVSPGRILLPRRGARHVLEARTDARIRAGYRLRLSEQDAGERGHQK